MHNQMVQNVAILRNEPWMTNLLLNVEWTSNYCLLAKIVDNECWLVTADTKIKQANNAIVNDIILLSVIDYILH